MLFHPTTEHKSLAKYECVNTQEAICLCQIHELEHNGQDTDRFYYYSDKGRYEKHVKSALQGDNWTQIVLCKRGYERYYLTKRLSKEAIIRRLRFIWIRNRDGFVFQDLSTILLNAKTDFRTDKADRTFLQHVNHLPHEMCLTKKSNLALNLQEYLKGVPVSELNGLKVHPETFFLQDEATYNAFIKILKPKVADTTKGAADLWIIKPTDSSGGRGITVVKDRGDFESKFVNNNEFKLQQIVKLSTSKNHARRQLLHANGNEEVPQWAYMNGYLAQKYIYNPLLLEGKKFDFRVYLLIAKATPKIYLFFHEGYLRVNIEAYDLSDINNTWSHVSNIGLQKKHPEFEQRKLDSKWTFQRFEDYLISKNIIKPEDNFIEKRLKPEMKAIMKIAVKAVEKKIGVGASEGCFALLGVDFIMDEHLNLWLTEFTKSPAGHASFAKDTLMPDMIAETIAILHEIEESTKTPRTNAPQSPTGLNSVRTFEQIEFYD